MNSRVRVIFSAMMIVLLALFSAISVIPARADDGAPPPPAAPSTAKTPAVHSQLPAGADVVVVNSSGHKVSLASQQAADIFASSDPIWCPSGVAPKPGLGGCTLMQGSFNGGLLPLIVNKAVNGTIWIVSGPETDILPIIMNGAGLGTTVFHALTLNGGWNGLPTGKLDPLNPSVFVVPVLINWNAAVTLNDIRISGTSSNGLYVTTTGNIVLNNFDAESNSGAGAYLDNTSGSGTVSVIYSSFNNNSMDGLDVLSKRAISIKHITAINNTAEGAYLDNCNWTGSACATLTAQPVTITGINTFNLNNGGLTVNSRGAITISNVTAVFNGGLSGVFLDNCHYNSGTSFCDIPGILAVNIKGTNNFSNNGYDGLDVFASGSITANNLNANNNGTNLDTIFPVNTQYDGMGVYLDNFGTPVPSGRPITLTGTNSFTRNAATGLWLDSYGAVKVSNLTANGNGQSSACYPTFICDGLNLPYWDASSFTLTGYGRFFGNGNDGIDGTVYGPVSLTNVTANGNGEWGVNVDNCDFDGTTHTCDAHGNVTLTGTNEFSNNGFTGFTAYSAGNVTLNNVDASFNGLAHIFSDGDGVYVDNCFYDPGTFHCDVTIPRSVLVNGANTFNGNYQVGLNAISSGAITAKQVTATDNGSTGAKLSNIYGFVPRNITLTGVNTFVNDGFDGLEFFASGAVNLTQVWADYNYLDGVFGSAVGRITITCGSMYSNTARGLEFTGSAITLKGVFSGPNGAPDLLFPAPVVTYLCPLP